MAYIDKIYPKQLQDIFTNRKAQLRFLEVSLESKKNIGLIGLRRIGKTLIIKEFMKRNPKKAIAFVDLERIDLVPEQFAVQYIGTILYWYLKPDKPIQSFYDIDVLISETAKLSLQVNSIVLGVSKELKKKQINQRTLLSYAFDFPAYLEDVVVVIDEFQEIVKINNYPQIKDVIALFRSHIQNQNVTYIIAGSAVRLMEKIFKEADSPLFAQFKLEYVTPFNKSDAKELVEKILGEVSEDIQNKIYRLTFGHPYYIASLCDTLKIMGFKKTSEVLKAFILETLTLKGGIYTICNYIYTRSLGTIRGETTVKSILKIIAQYEGQTLSEIAKKMKRDNSTIQSLLKRLIDVDLIIKKDGEYYFRDPVFRYWLVNTQLGYEFDYEPGKKDLEFLIKKLREEVMELKTERGMLFESYIREFVRENFKGQYTKGTVFGIDERIKLPKVQKVEKLYEVDYDVDALIFGDENWLVEVKARNRPIGINEVRKTLDRMDLIENKKNLKIDKIWLISESGFTKKAITLMRKNKVLYSDRKILGKRV